MTTDSNPNNDSKENKPHLKLTPQVWIVFLCLIAALISYMFWSKPKESPNTPVVSVPAAAAAPISKGIDREASASFIEGTAIFIPPVGKLFSLNTRVSGILKRFYIQPGDFVKEGQLLAEISDYDYTQKLARAKLNTKKTTEELQTLTEQIGKEEEAQLNVLKAQLSASEFNVIQIERRIKSLKRSIEVKKKLLEKGLIAPTRISEAEDSLSAVEVERETVKSTMANLRFNLLKGYRTEDLKSKKESLRRSLDELNLLEYLEHYYKILSPWDAQVLELSSSEGDVVSRGQMIALLETEKAKGLPDRLMAFFSIEQGKRIQIGAQALITVSTIDSKVYGQVIGKVAKVSKYPVSSESVSKLFFNQGLVRFLTEGKSTIVVTIIPELDASGTGFKWTKGKQPTIPITTGNVATVRIVF